MRKTLLRLAATAALAGAVSTGVTSAASASPAEREPEGGNPLAGLLDALPIIRDVLEGSSNSLG